MEIKSMSKIASVSLTIVLLLGGHSFGAFSNAAWAQTSPSPNPSESESSAPSKAIGTSIPSPSMPQAPEPESNKLTQGTFPIWLWFILGGLGLWNVALSVLFWQSTKDSNRSNYEINQRLKKLKETDADINQRVSRKFDELKQQLSSYKKNLEVGQLQAQAKPLASDSYNFESRTNPATYGNSDPFVNQDYVYKSRSTNYAQPAPAINDPWGSIVQNYNNSPQILENNIIERVSESEESVASRRGNSNAAVFLKAANNYSYWVFAGDDRNYWLTPKSDLKITPIGFDTLQALFECSEYQQGSKIQMIKPAKVAQNSFSGGWDLVEKGQVQFIR
jgi:hypothetical protein